MTMRPNALTASAFAGLVLISTVLTACSGDDGAVSDGRSAEEVLELAKTTLDETSGVSITLATDDLPAGVTGIKGAEGIGTHAPAFEGSITVVLSGTDFDVPIIAVDDTVYAQIPLTPGWSDVDPTEYGAPDPAGLMSTETGFSSLLPATQDAEEGESVRGGENNDEVLTEYTGTVSADVVSNVIPSAEGDFDVIYTITADGELRTADLTGVFYPSTDQMTYSLGFDDYGTEQEITAP